MQIKRDQAIAACQEQKHRQGIERQRNVDLETKGVSDTVVILLAEKLSSEKSGTRNRAEDTQIKDKQKLIDDRYTRHLLGSDSSHHYVIQQTDEIGDGVLYQDRNHDREQVFVKNFCSKKRFEVKIRHNICLGRGLAPIFAVKASELNCLGNVGCAD